MSSGLSAGFMLDRQWHWLRGELETTKKPDLLTLGRILSESRMTPAERMALTVRLGEEGLAEYMSANGLDRAEAIKAIKRSRRLGRRPSRCFDDLIDTVYARSASTGCNLAALMDG